MPGTAEIFVVFQNRVLVIFFPGAEQIFGAGNAGFVIAFLIAASAGRIGGIEEVILAEYTNAFHKLSFPGNIVPEQFMRFSKYLSAFFIDLLRPHRSGLSAAVAFFLPEIGRA